MKADSWGSLEQTMASCHNLGRQSKDYRKRNRSNLSNSVGCLNLVEFLLWCYLVSCSLPGVKVG